AWALYLALRRAESEDLREILTSLEEQDEGDDEPYKVIKLAVDKVLERTGFDADAAQAIRDCIVPIGPDVVDDGGCAVREATIFTRIYSPTNPAAIDVYLDYWYRARWTYVEFFCTVFYRLHRVICTDKLDSFTPQGPADMNGFRVFFELGLADVSPGRKWRAIDKRKFGIDEADARVIHEVLFGQPEGDSAPAGMISVKETLSLLLASVGVSFGAAVDPKDADDRDTFSMEPLRCDGLSANSARWLGKNIRRVSGEGAEGDDDNEDPEGAVDDGEDEEAEESEDEGW
ncbi:hypothetical protein FB45DRAFT_742873, partial [Roridomyces roridus]